MLFNNVLIVMVTYTFRTVTDYGFIFSSVCPRQAYPAVFQRFLSLSLGSGIPPEDVPFYFIYTPIPLRCDLPR